MKTLTFLLIAFWALPLNAEELKLISFSQDTVTEIDGRVLKFLTGSVWLLEREIIGIPMSEGTILCNGSAPKYEEGKIKEYIAALPKSGILMYKGEVVEAKLISGSFVLQDGYLTTVVEEHGDGAVLETNDGSFWSIPSYDQYDTGYWLPPYPAIIFKNERYLINLKRGKKVWIEKRIK